MAARRTSAALASVTLLVAPAAARAQQPPLHVVLSYQVDSALRNCPTASELQASVVQQLGYDPFSGSPGSPRHDVRVVLSRQGGATDARIEWLDEGGAVQGERRLSSPDNDCAELGAGVAFAVAVQLQLRASSAPPSPPPPPSAPPPRKTPPPAPRPAAPLSSSTLLVGAGGLVRGGSQPGLAAGVRAWAGIGGSAWALHLDAHATLPTTARDARGSGFSARELGLGVAPCFRRWVLDACGLAAFSLLSIRGEGVDQPRSPSAPTLGVGLRLQLALPWRDRLAAVIHADLLAQLAPQDILVNREPVWSTAPVGVAVGLDVAAIFR